MSRGRAQQLYHDFDALARGAGRRCGPPRLGPGRARATRRLTARAANVDATLCPHRDDARVRIPGSFVIDACWDGSAIWLDNRGNFVRQVKIGGSMGPPVRRAVTAVTLASIYIERKTASDILPPGFRAKTTAGSTYGFITVEPAPPGLRQQYTLAKYIEGFLPARPGGSQYTRWLHPGLAKRSHRGGQLRSKVERHREDSLRGTFHLAGRSRRLHRRDRAFPP